MSKFVYIERKLGLKTMLYYPALIKGLFVTGKHFFVNMTRHIKYSLGMKGGKPGSYTLQYPEVMRPLHENLRTKHRIKVHEDGRPKCTACMLCETVCPDFCISITPAEHDESQEEKAPIEFRIDLDRCCFCGFCVEACPKDAIYMDSRIMEIASDNRDNFVLKLADLLDPKPIQCTGIEFKGKDPNKVLPHLEYRDNSKVKPVAVNIDYTKEKSESSTKSRIASGNAA
jgi:NADH-quinone oxidoreductase subunit I